MSGEDSDGSEEEVDEGVETIDLVREEDKEDYEGQAPAGSHEIPPNMTVESTSVE
jgi:hypothetical protein